MAKKVGMYSATHESVTVPEGRDRKIQTVPRTNQIARFVTVPSEKKKKKIYIYIYIYIHIHMWVSLFDIYIYIYID